MMKLYPKAIFGSSKMVGKKKIKNNERKEKGKEINIQFVIVWLCIKIFKKKKEIYFYNFPFWQL